jgi:hypothetical protein
VSETRTEELLTLVIAMAKLTRLFYWDRQTGGKVTEM